MTARGRSSFADAATTVGLFDSMAGPPKEPVVARVRPVVEDGRYPVRRVVGDPVSVRADVFVPTNADADAALRFRPIGSRAWSEVLMVARGNDEWSAQFVPPEVGRYEFTVAGWTDRFGSWTRRARAWHTAGEEIRTDAAPTRALLRRIGARTTGPLRARFSELIDLAEAERWNGFFELADLPDLQLEIRRRQPRSDLVEFAPPISVEVERRHAGVASWYEMFPRSQGREPGRSATWAEATQRLDRVAALGFDVVYLPPIHPIGRTHRRGRDNAPVAGPDDPGSPWAIGGPEGGHTSFHPELGGAPEFAGFVARAGELGLEVALDLAFQCSPDHPWVTEHPEWFVHRPDGTIRYAENPPKRYPDIYPFDFSSPAWRSLWEALRDVVWFWVDRGVRAFRVDNPHTKPFPFWEWLIRETRARNPDVVFLAEAFTRPKVMYHLAAVGFSQSYTFFTWRNEREELERYFTELSTPPVCEYFRPMLFVNTPDILPSFLANGGRPEFECRAVLAATLSPLWGIYSGFEHLERDGAEGSEEYLHSEKYEIRTRGAESPGPLEPVIRRLNEVRRSHPALQTLHHLRFVPVDHPRVVAYLRWSTVPEEVVLTAVNLHPRARAEASVELPLGALGLPADRPFEVRDLLTDERWTWRGPRNYVKLDPAERVAHVFSLAGARPPGEP